MMTFPGLDLNSESRLCHAARNIRVETFDEPRQVGFWSIGSIKAILPEPQMYRKAESIIHQYVWPGFARIVALFVR